MAAQTALQIIIDAYGILNVYMPGETPQDNQAQQALRFLNRMVGGWSQQAQLIPVIAREVFDLTADKGGPSNPYTIGSGGNLNTAKPANQKSITNAAVLLTAPDDDVEVPLALLTDDGYAAIAIKELSNSVPTALYYRPTYTTSDLGTINLWPVPDTATNDLVLYIQKALTRFADLSTSYYFPEGVDEALVYNLALRLNGPVGGRMTATDQQLAVSRFEAMMRANLNLTDVANDAAMFTRNRRTLYNINTGV